MTKSAPPAKEIAELFQRRWKGKQKNPMLPVHRFIGQKAQTMWLHTNDADAILIHSITVDIFWQVEMVELRNPVN